VEILRFAQDDDFASYHEVEKRSGAAGEGMVGPPEQCTKKEAHG
jgi:hypothetical protein